MLNTEKRSFVYTLLYGLVKFYFHLYYRKVTITGRENVPEGVPVIFASNHQNALMDALAVLFAARRPVVFLARADIFKKPRIARLLYFLKILPVYRIRDGAETLGKNEAIFNLTTRILHSGVPLALLPEGTHSSIKHLQPLKKGICRIAFLTAKTGENSGQLCIIPIGLDYENYRNAGTHLLINYGKPIQVSSYYHLYHENPTKAIVKLRDDLSAEIKKRMIHVEYVDQYDTIYSLALMLTPVYLRNNNKPANRITRFEGTQLLVQKIEKAHSEGMIDLTAVNNDLTSYRKLLRENRLNDGAIADKPETICSLFFALGLSLLAAPVHIYGMIFSYLPYKLPVLFSSKTKDPQFISSLNFGLSFMLFPLWYLLLFSLTLAISANVATVAILFFSWPLSGLFAFYHYLSVRKIRSRLRTILLRRHKPAVYRQILDNKNTLIELINHLNI